MHKKPHPKILVTGISSGIGLELCKILLANNYQVIGTTRHSSTTITSLPPHLATNPNLILLDYHQDSRTSIEDFYKKNQVLLSDLQGFISNAGSGQLNSIENCSWDDFEKLQWINGLGPMLLTKLLLPQLIKNQATLIYVSSVVAHLAFPFKAAYCSAKSSLSSFASSLRHEVKSQGARVHVIEPGWVKSNFHQRIPPIQAADLHSVYGNYIEAFAHLDGDKDPKTSTSLQVAQTIFDVLQNPRAPFRKGCGRDYRAVRLILRLLPDQLALSLMDHYLQKKYKRTHV